VVAGALLLAFSSTSRCSGALISSRHPFKFTRVLTLPTVFLIDHGTRYRRVLGAQENLR